MQHAEIEQVRRHNASWRLLRADNAPLIISFLGRVFIEENIREISAAQLIDRLDDEIYALDQAGVSYPKSPRAYLDDWAGSETGWLRKYYPADADEAHFDATPALEQAVAFVTSLKARSFVGTESRLNTVFELLRQMARGAEHDPARRIEDLQRQRAVIDAQLARAERGDIDVLDETAQRDRFQQFAALARDLLSDFRSVEANFRDLDRATRERIASWDAGKGELLDDILATRGGITESDQGKSFAAFYDFLLSADRQKEFADLLDTVLALAAITDADPALRTVHYQWLAAGERTQATVRLLSEQLRRFLDDRVWLENRRISEILKSIEAHAFGLRDTDGEPPGSEVDEASPRVNLPMERRLYTPKRKHVVDSRNVATGDGDFENELLFQQVYVDPLELAEGVRLSLASRAQIDLTELLESAPLQRGLAELLTYFALTDEGFSVVFDDESTTELSWVDDEGTTRKANLPRVTFVRGNRHTSTGSQVRSG